MRQRMGFRKVTCVLAAVVALAGVAPAQARDARHGPARRSRATTVPEARAAKQECRAGDEKTRAECRQEKRDH